jgi:hypothetical protein
MAQSESDKALAPADSSEEGATSTSPAGADSGEGIDQFATVFNMPPQPFMPANFSNLEAFFSSSFGKVVYGTYKSF